MSKKNLSAAVSTALLGLALLAGTPAGAKPVGKKKVEVRVAGIQAKRGGTLLVMVFRRNGFPVKHGAAVFAKRIAVKSSRARFLISVPAAGMFALKILHDENGDGKVNKRIGIIPKEGMGFSNGARIRFGPPKFSAARLDAFRVRGPLRVKMQYF